MKYVAVVVLLLALFFSGYWLAPRESECDCTRCSIELVQENSLLVLENQRITEKIKKQQASQDSLLLLAANERQKVTEIRMKQNEKNQAIDHFSNDELLNFFAELKADSAKNSE